MRNGINSRAGLSQAEKIADSADPNYVFLVSALLRAGWHVQVDGQVYHNDGHGPMSVHEALIACVNVASEA